jgi:superfamily I DNA and/or RNA helicase
MRRLPPHSEGAAALEKEALEYRSNLEKLKHFLPDLQVRLLAEKLRLESARTHVASAAAWARANKKTL